MNDKYKNSPTCWVCALCEDYAFRELKEEGEEPLYLCDRCKHLIENRIKNRKDATFFDYTEAIKDLRKGKQ